MGFKLVSYQQQAVAAFNNYVTALSGRKPVIVLPTGCGKTAVFNKIIHDFCEMRSKKPKRSLVLVHTVELVKQTYAALQDQYPFLVDKMYGTRPALSMLQAENKNFDSVITVASMQTLAVAGDDESRKALETYLSFGEPSFVIIDEAHHSASDTYADVIVPRLLEANKGVVILGVTATPARADGRALETVFDDIVFQMNIQDAIEGGWLKAISAKSVKAEVDTTAAVREDSTLDNRKLIAALRAANWPQIVADVWLEETGGKRQTIAFMPDIQMSQQLCRYLNAHGVSAASIDYQDVIGPDGDQQEAGLSYWQYRDHLIEEYRAGRIRVLCGMNALLEGFDAPNTSCILWGRPTQSSVLLTQALGRGLRRPPGFARILKDGDATILEDYDGKRFRYPAGKCPYHTDCVVLDFTLTGTPLLLAGSLVGRTKIDLPDVEDLEEPKVLDIFDVVPIDRDFDRILQEADGWRTFDRNFFRMAHDAWQIMPDGTMSVYNGDGAGLFIVPRSKLLTVKMRRIITMLNQLEGTGTVDDTKLRSAKRQYLAAARMFESFNLFMIQAPKPGHYPDGREKFVVWGSKATQAAFVGRFPDHHQAWAVALPISQGQSTGGVYSRRDANWRRKAATEKGIQFLTSPSKMCGGMIVQANSELGDLREAHGIRIFIKEVDPVEIASTAMGISQIAGLTAGRVSSIATHCMMQSIIMQRFMNQRVLAVYAAERYWELKFNERP